ncbi:MAG: hypothetical protein E7296_07765 [Lachnospiraceae bacterium]|jgi:hypothetical protein|nr:hypothetical protein [Lachnospiraceae bacterium]
MNELEVFLSKINLICKEQGSLSVEAARKVIYEINSFLFTKYKGIGTLSEFEKKYEYLSDFHKYWEKNHKEILNVQIDDEKCEEVADALHDVYVKTGGRAFREVYDTNGLNDEEVCQIRFLTANQDFRGSRDFKELSDIYKRDPDIFAVEYVVRKPVGFLNSLDMADLSQTDKRITYAKTIGQFLYERNSTPYELLNYYNNDVYKLRQDLIKYVGAGFGNKKADMFIRDMVVLGIWKNVKGFEKIDVASDVNTIKVALRTGILESAIPLVSSFLDIFCYQYSYIDQMNAKAWRRVWEIWREKYPERIESPSLLDYFIYRIVGKEFCKENLFTYECVNGHEFKWRNSKKSICPTCKEKAEVIYEQYMCDNEDGSIITSQFLPEFTNCPLKSVCDSSNKKKLQPPKSISIFGKTGWTSAYSEREGGGGGLMA